MTTKLPGAPGAPGHILDLLKRRPNPIVNPRLQLQQDSRKIKVKVVNKLPKDEKDEKDEKDKRVQVVDKRKMGNVERENIKKRLQKQLHVGKKPSSFIKEDVLVILPEKDKEPKTFQIKIKKPTKVVGKQIELQSTVSKKKSAKRGKDDTKGDEQSMPEGKSITIRRTKKPLEHIVSVVPSKQFKIGKTILNNRIAKKKPNILIKRSEYYMNNREIFINFINSLFEPYKDEIIKNEGQVSCDNNPEKEFSLLTHQNIVRDYLNLITPYRGLLLYHGLGSGKTCSSIAIAEGMKTSKPIIVMTPASLRMNYAEELKKCGDSIYRKNQFWEFIKIDDSGEASKELIDVLSYTLSLDVNTIKKNGGAWMVNVKRKANFEKLSPAEKKSVDTQLNEMIRYKYRFINYNGIRMSNLKSFTKDFTINPFDNAVIIIDEAHNFVSRIVNKLNRKDSLAYKLYEYMMDSDQSKYIFLTGTPIINYPNEIGILFNILRGKIQTWSFKLSIQNDKKVNLDYLKNIFSKLNILDYIEYKPSSTTLVVTRNPFGFYDVVKKNNYKGVNLDSLGDISNEEFETMIIKALGKHNIKVIENGTTVERHKALPDTLDGFQSYFINSTNNDMKNIDLFQRRILGLTSYFRSAQEQLMPRYEKETDFRVIEIPMSNFQFSIYEEARVQERKIESRNAKKRKKAGPKKDGLYEDSVSTYRIFSRAFCNFVFPRPDIIRPMPRDGEDIETAILEQTADEDLLDAANVDQKIKNPDGSYSLDDKKLIEQAQEEVSDKNYEDRIHDALTMLKRNSDKFLSPEALETYSPKFLNILENILEKDHEGLHLIYSQFRTLEGIGILKLILEANGFAHFKLKQENGFWVLNIPKEDRGKPTFALYTGTETSEEKEIIRNIFNSAWQFVPNNLVTELQKISSNNFYGEIMRVLMITASGAEGISLKNVRYVHITEPYWHPVRIEQVVGRARRICSHTDLPKELQTVKVFLYLMKFSQEQLDSDESVELRIKDKSKIDYAKPITTDQALFEISTIKENINKQILNAIQESAIDCSLHSKPGDNLKCYSFGGVSSEKFTYSPSISDEEFDSAAAINKQTIEWEAREVTIEGKEYAYNEDTKEVFDLDSYKQDKLILRGHIEEGPNGKVIFDKI
jgi:hypothetical protein